MALNKFMHQRNTYRNKKPDFAALALKYPEFKQLVTQEANGKITLDFKDVKCLRGLTQTLLKDDFNLEVALPLDRLIPTVPQRLNYVHWIEDLIGQGVPTRGIDIGTGASCIYPLLGCRLNHWTFLATELDDQNLHFSKKNIETNSMQAKIKVIKVDEGQMLLDVVEEGQQYGFCMCNPPFFCDNLEAQGILNTRSDNRPEPHSISSAAEVESIAWGGEVAFVTQMIEDSLILRDRVRVYTSLIGRKLNLSLLKDELRKKRVPHFASTEFCQGKTMRWGLAWTFDETINFPKSPFQQKKQVYKPVILDISQDWLDTEYTVPALTVHIKAMLDSVQITYAEKITHKFLTTLTLNVMSNTWSHQRRKRRQEGRQSKPSLETSPSKGGHSDSVTDSVSSQSTVSTNNSQTSSEESRCENQQDYNASSREEDNKTRSSKLGHVDVDTNEVPPKKPKTEETVDGENKFRNQCDQQVAGSSKEGDMTKRIISSQASDSETKETFESKLKTSEGVTHNLACDLVLKKKDGNISLKLVFIEGSREWMYQIMQYFKNQFLQCRK